MSEEKSIYLDIVRFLAAVSVFIGHATGSAFTDGFLWPFSIYMDTAVMVFFVLSGFVIAYVTRFKETTLRDYTVSRVSRLYSVVIPALILTIFCDSIGMSIDEDFYREARWKITEGNQSLNYLLSFFLLHTIWDINLNPGSNVPFWSLCFEFIYYCLFAAIFFLRGKSRVIIVFSIMALAGPSITALFPIWLMGYAAFQLQGQPLLTDKPLAGAFISLSALIALFVLAPTIRNDYQVDMGMINRPTIFADYFDAIMLSIHLIFITPVLAAVKSVLIKLSPIIRWAASLTFALYLFHRPLFQLFAVIGPEDPSSWQRRFLMIGVTFLIIAILGRWCEKQKHPLKRQINRLLDKPGWQSTQLKITNSGAKPDQSCHSTINSRHL